jgi:7-keto-8-aminopelargonate synthetase-like enzyme
MDDRPILDGHRMSGGDSARLYLDGHEYLNFGGCNYLALSQRPELRHAAQNALDRGCAFSQYLVRAYGGSYEHFDAVEREAALFWGTESAVYLPSGFHIGFAAMAALEPLCDVIVLDEMAHWCMSDAAALSGKPVRKFAHCDPDALAAELDALDADARPLVATDGAFATTGELPPLNRYMPLIEDRDGQLLVDESHSAGVVGDTGRGAAQHFGIEGRVHVGATLSKGLCGQGAVYTGSATAIERSRTAHALRGSNPGSPISAAVSATALRLVRENPDLCGALRKKAQYLRIALRRQDLEIADTPASIVAFSRGSFGEMRALQQHLFDAGIYVLHSNYIAAGPSGTIRLTVFADHSTADLDRFVEEVGQFFAATDPSGRQAMA